MFESAPVITNPDYASHQPLINPFSQDYYRFPPTSQQQIVAEQLHALFPVNLHQLSFAHIHTHMLENHPDTWISKSSATPTIERLIAFFQYRRHLVTELGYILIQPPTPTHNHYRLVSSLTQDHQWLTPPPHYGDIAPLTPKPTPHS